MPEQISCTKSCFGVDFFFLGPDLEERIPRTSAECHTITAYSQAAYAVIMSLQSEHSLALKSVPSVAVEIVVASKQKSTADAERNAGNTAQNALVSVLHELSISADIEQSAARIVAASAEGHAVREERNRVDVALVSGECLSAFSSSHIPQFGSSIASTADKRVFVCWVDADTHDIAIVVVEFGNFATSLDIPQNTSHITRGRHDLAIAQKSAATEVASVAVEFATNANGNFARTQVVHRADVVQTTASYEASAGRIGARHHPRRS